MSFRKSFSVLFLAVLSFSIGGCTKEDGVNVNIPGLVGPNVELVNGYVLLKMVFADLSADVGVTIPIPKYPNSSIQIGPDFQSAGTLFVLAVSTKDFLNDRGNGFKENLTLPGGRPLPGVGSGTLPGVAIVIPQLLNSTFYVGREVIGLFVPFEFRSGGITGSYRFYDGAKKPIGILALVGEDANRKNSGLLALMRADLLGILPSPSAAALRKLDQMF